MRCGSPQVVSLLLSNDNVVRLFPVPIKLSSQRARRQTMHAPNLVLKYTIDGDSRVHIKGALRIKVDGCGALMLYGSEDGKVESVRVRLRPIAHHPFDRQPACLRHGNDRITSPPPKLAQRNAP